MIAACRLGLEFVEGQKTFRWFGNWMRDYNSSDAAYLQGIDPKEYGKCEHAIRVPNDSTAYEIGVCKNPKGEGYVLVYDFFGSGRNIYERCGGKGLEKLIQEYQVAVVEQNPEVQELQLQGFSIERQMADNGDIQLMISNEV